MKGLELSKRYFETYGQELLNKFPEIASSVTVGLVGEGSECYGFDDEISQDHDFEPAFCIWLDKEKEEEFGFRLERAYAKLPKEFLGYTRQRLSPCGGNRHGLLLTEDFYEKFLGQGSLPESNIDWFRIPSYALSEATNGQIFQEGTGKFMQMRKVLLQGYPEDVRLKKISASLALMQQAGKYNYPRCLKHNETGAAQLALYEFVNNALQACFLLNHSYCPFYKWAFRTMRSLPVLSETELPLTYLIENPNAQGNIDYKIGIIEDISTLILNEVKRQGITSASCNNLDTHAYSIADKIKDPFLRNLHILQN